MKYPLVLLLLLCPLVVFSQNDQVDKLKSYLESKEYDKAKSLIAERLEQSRTDNTVNKAAMWYYKGRVCSQMYFEKANSVEENEAAYKQRAYTLLSAIAAFQNTCKKEDTYYRNMAYRQLGGLHRFLKTLGLSYLETGNHERAYLNLRWSRNCDKFINRHIDDEAYQMDTMLIYLTIYTGELTERTYESKWLYEELRLQGVSEEQMYVHNYMMLAGLGQDEKAESILRTGLAKFPNSISLTMYTLHWLNSQGRFEEVIQLVDQKLDIPGHPKARLYFIKGMAANQQYETISGRYPQEAETYFYIAEAAYRKALDLSPSSFDYTYSLAALYYNKALLLDQEDKSSTQSEAYAQMIQRAEETLEITMLLNANNSNVIGALKDIYQRTNQTQKLDNLEKL